MLSRFVRRPGAEPGEVRVGRPAHGRPVAHIIGDRALPLDDRPRAACSAAIILTPTGQPPEEVPEVERCTRYGCLGLWPEAVPAPAPSRLVRVVRLAPLVDGQLRPRSVKRAAAVVRELDAAPPPREQVCRCPDVDSSVPLEEWRDGGCPVHPGEPGESDGADARAARAALDAKLARVGRAGAR